MCITVMTKKGTRKTNNVASILKFYNKDVKRHMSALSEDFQDKVSAVAEQFLGVNRKLDSLTERLDSHTEMIGRMATDMRLLRGTLSS